MTQIQIPYYVSPPALSPALIDEITAIIFGETIYPEPCDLIFIFGGSHPGLWEKGAEAFFKGYGEHILVTGGYKPGALRHHTWVDQDTAEALVIRRELVRLGVPEGNITLETRSTNTYENVRFALEIFDFRPVSSVLAVCKSYGVGRQIRTLQAQLTAGVRVIPYPFETQLGGKGPVITRENWMDHPDGRAYLYANLLKIIQYGRAGHLVPVDRISDELGTIVQDYFKNE